MAQVAATCRECARDIMVGEMASELLVHDLNDPAGPRLARRYVCTDCDPE